MRLIFVKNTLLLVLIVFFPAVMVKRELFKAVPFSVKKQWAAVRTWRCPTMLPPHKCCPR